MKFALILGVSLSLIASIAVAQSSMHERGAVDTRAASASCDQGCGASSGSGSCTIK